MLRRLRQTWQMLGKDINVGQRYKRNLKSIRDMAVILIFAGTVMFIWNIIEHAYLISLTSLAIIIAGIGIYIYIGKEKRKAGMILTIAVVMLVFTYDIFFATNGFAFLWTMLIPLAISYLFSAKTGILVSVYFWLLFLLTFYTPLRSLVEDNYPAIILNRFPVLYFFHILFTGFVMIQYHKSVLDQMNYNDQLQQAMEEAEQAREEAERANVAKSDFLASMSHEIRTPINAVLGMNEMIIRESAKAQDSLSSVSASDAFSSISVYAGNIQSAGRSLLSTINDILDFSKIEAGRMELVEGKYRLSSLVNDLSNMVLFQAREKGLDFHTDMDETIPDLLYGDEVHIRQALTNLLSNAVKYTYKGSILLKIRGTAEEMKAGEIVTMTVTVKDTGTGIRQEDISKLFEKFQRVDLEMNSTVEGAGLGLAITQRLLAMMGGEIRVESVYGQGSTFTAVFPQRIVSCEPVGDFRSKNYSDLTEAKKYREIFRAPDAHILIVDDTRMNLSVVIGLLRETKIRIDAAVSGKEAIKMTKITGYDLILMDHRMPEMDGTEAMQHIREQKDGLNLLTPVICLTADAVIGARERYLAHGFTDYITKPIDSEALEKILIKYLPSEKVVKLTIEETDISSDDYEPRDQAFVFLRYTDVDIETGLLYCQGDESLYHSMLAEFLENAEEKTQEIQTYFDNGDWENYEILVHALKSTSRMIGALSLSETAAALETASSKIDLNTLQQIHPKMMKQYSALQEVLAANIDIDQSDTDSDEILEFMPE